MSGFVPINRYTFKMTISEQDILRTLMKSRDRIAVDVERVEERRRRELGARQDWAGNRCEALSRIGGPRTRFARWPWAVAAGAWLSVHRGAGQVCDRSGSLD